MAKKGGNKTEKRLNTSNLRHLKRKEFTFTIKTSPGPHTTDSAIPLGFIIRDLLEVAQNSKEIKQILGAGQFAVDGIVRKDPKFPVGLFDMIEIIPKKEHYVMVLKNKRFAVQKVDAKNAGKKISKVAKKHLVKGGFIQVQTEDGRIFNEKSTTVKVNDSVVIDLKSKKIADVLPLKEGKMVYIISGSRTGETAMIKGILKGTTTRQALINLSNGNGEFQTTERNIVVINAQAEEWVKN